MRTTHTYAVLEIGPPAFNEIARKLQEAGYADAFGEHEGRPCIDMHGIALAPDAEMKAGDVSFQAGSMLSQRTRQGMVQVRVNDVAMQMDLDKAREVVRILQGAIEAATTDQIVFQFLIDKVEMRPEAAAAALGDLQELRQGSRSVVIPS